MDAQTHYNNIKQAYASLDAKLEQALQALGRDRGEVLILGVSKNSSIDEIDAAYQAGCRAFGENRPDVLVEKFKERPHYTWHFIGNIQSRQIPKIVACSSLIHSLYKLEHLHKIDKAAANLGKIQECLVQVDISCEESKSGCKIEDLAALLDEAQALNNVRITGLMTMAPKSPESWIVATFKGLESLRTELLTRYPLGETSALHSSISLKELSSGMSQDWQCAIQHGSTIIRIGRSLFSPEEFKLHKG